MVKHIHLIRRMIGVSLLAVIGIATLAQNDPSDAGQTQPSPSVGTISTAVEAVDVTVYPYLDPNEDSNWPNIAMELITAARRAHEGGNLVTQSPTSTTSLPVDSVVIATSGMPYGEEWIGPSGSGFALFAINSTSLPDVSMPRYIYEGMGLRNFDLVGCDLISSDFTYLPDSPYFACFIMEMDSDGDGVKDANAHDWEPVAFVICYNGYNRAAVYYYPNGFRSVASPILYYVKADYSGSIGSNHITIRGTGIDIHYRLPSRPGHNANDPGLPLWHASRWWNDPEEEYLLRQVSSLENTMMQRLFNLHLAVDEKLADLQRRIDALEAAGQAGDDDGD